jgi:hypothetical protein
MKRDSRGRRKQGLALLNSVLNSLSLLATLFSLKNALSRLVLVTGHFSKSGCKSLDTQQIRLPCLIMRSD